MLLSFHKSVPAVTEPFQYLKLCFNYSSITSITLKDSHFFLSNIDVSDGSLNIEVLMKQSPLIFHYSINLYIIFSPPAKIRRLYDIANVLSSLDLIKKVHVNEERGRKPAFKWTGPDVSPNASGMYLFS